MGKRGSCYRCGDTTGPMDAYCDACRARATDAPITDDDDNQ